MSSDSVLRGCNGEGRGISARGGVVQLTVQSFMIELKDQMSFLCTMWTKKLFNSDNFWAQMKCLKN